MRIFHLCAGAPVGGAETAFVQTCIAMHEAGWDVTAICRPHITMTGPLGEAEVPTYTLPFDKFFDLRTKSTIRDLIKEKQPDIIQTWMNRAAQAMPRPSAKLPPFTPIARLGGYYDIKYYKGIEHFIAATPDLKRYLIEEGAKPDNVAVINNLVMLENDDNAIKRSDLDTPEDAFVFLTLSRLHNVKGIDDFIDALATLPEKAYGWIAGEGPERPALEHRVHEKNIGHRVKFLGWRQDRTALLKAADSLVFPSRYEPFGNTFAQAWAAQTPLITTNSAGPSQFVRHNEDALLVPIAAPVELGAAMQRLMDEPELGPRLSQAGYKRYAENFTVSATLTAYKKLYESIRHKH